MFLMNTERVFLFEGNSDIYLDLYVINDTRLAARDGMLVIPGGAYGAVCMDREGEKTALAYLVHSPIERIFAFSISDADMELLARATEKYITNQLERSFKSLEFYKEVKR